WLASIMVMASCVAVLFGDKIRSQSKPFLYLFQLVAAKDPVHDEQLVSPRPSWAAGPQPALH
ncbi:hypothetical protein VCX68_13215, partial [Aeromonas caviae]|uniref:hypothetical protein n=1 Tax=Aeromonas caviae TaxID=648 RepID=UPI002B253668